MDTCSYLTPLDYLGGPCPDLERVEIKLMVQLPNTFICYKQLPHFILLSYYAY